MAPRFRTVPVNDGMDYSYAGWTTAGETPWSSGTFPTYDDSVVNMGRDLGITFYALGNGYGNNTRFRLNTAGMGYLFNGVLYAMAPGSNFGQRPVSHEVPSRPPSQYQLRARS